MPDIGSRNYAVDLVRAMTEVTDVETRQELIFGRPGRQVTLTIRGWVDDATASTRADLAITEEERAEVLRGLDALQLEVRSA